MTGAVSEGKRAANRANARKSTGPRTAAGKARVAGNARRHGLAASVLRDPAQAQPVDALARQICRTDGGTDDPARGPALRRRFVVARRIAEAQVDVLRVRRARHDLIAAALADRRPPRPEKLALILAGHARELAVLDRYERRARSRRRLAIREFDAARLGRRALPSSPLVWGLDPGRLAALAAIGRLGRMRLSSIPRARHGGRRRVAGGDRSAGRSAAHRRAGVPPNPPALWPNKATAAGGAQAFWPNKATARNGSRYCEIVRRAAAESGVTLAGAGKFPPPRQAAAVLHHLLGLEATGPPPVA